jgi:hypothetical protein
MALKQVPLIVLVHSLHEDLGEDPGSWTKVNPTLISDLISVDYSQPHWLNTLVYTSMNMVKSM